MAPDPGLQQAVDEVLEAAWPTERRRAVVRTATSVLGRVAVFVLALLVFSLAVNLFFGLVVPWTFFAFMAGLALVCSRRGEEERAHLHRQTTGSRASRPSTGCYPHNGWDDRFD
jgi:hypothetical protein